MTTSAGGAFLVVFLGLFWLSLVVGCLALLRRLWQHTAPKTSPARGWPPVRPEGVVAHLKNSAIVPLSVSSMPIPGTPVPGGHMWAVDLGTLTLDQVALIGCDTLAPGNGLSVVGFVGPERPLNGFG